MQIQYALASRVHPEHLFHFFLRDLSDLTCFRGAISFPYI